MANIFDTAWDHITTRWATIIVPNRATFAAVGLTTLVIGIGVTRWWDAEAIAIAYQDRDLYKDKLDTVKPVQKIVYVPDRSASAGTAPFIDGWTIFNNSSPVISIDTAKLPVAADKFNVLLVNRIEYSDVDEMSDTAIATSIPYTITGGHISMADTHIDLLKWSTTGPNILRFYVIALPKTFSGAQLRTLADVPALGGKILAHVGITIPAIKNVLERLPNGKTKILQGTK